MNYKASGFCGEDDCRARSRKPNAKLNSVNAQRRADELQARMQQEEHWIAIPDDKPLPVKVNTENPPKKPRKLNIEQLKKGASST